MEGLFPPGVVLLDKYRVEGVIGRGGMGIVLRVTHLQLGEQLALKLLLPEAAANAEVTGRFLREAQAAARLRGEHVTRVSDVGVLANGAPFIAMEYLRGVDLAGELARRRVLPPGEAVDYVLQVCEALAEAHANGIIHRDIKSANMFLTTRPDGTPMIKVLDFGISKAPIAMGPSTVTDMVMGTPGYMSPEQMRAAKDVDGRTDIWALGIVLYECLNGRRPFDAESFSAAVLKAGMEPPPPMDPKVPRALQAVVLRCLEKERTARYATIGALAAALAPFARDKRAAGMIVDRTKLMQRRAGESVPPPVTPVPPPEMRKPATTLSGGAGQSGELPRRRGRAMPVAIGAGVVLVAVVILIAVNQAGAPGKSDGAGSDVATAGVDGGSTTGLTAAVTTEGSAGAMSDAAPEAGPATADPGSSADALGSSSAGDGAKNIDSDRGNIQLGNCAVLLANHNWQALRDCAASLKLRGDTAKAKDYADVALREQQNELTAQVVQQLLREKNLKDAQAELAKIGNDSVYFVPLRDAFIKAENAAIEQAISKANAFVAAHDCASFHTEYKQLQQSSTPRVAASIAAIKCTEQAASSGADGTNPSAKGDCGKVDELVSQAGMQFSAGFYPTALNLINRALACQQNDKMYRLATIYACAAHDLATAKRYYAKVTPTNQPSLVQRCLQEGLDPRPSPL